jgi:digeranylgeranylglycerophospholipid reductase
MKRRAGPAAPPAALAWAELVPALTRGAAAMDHDCIVVGASFSGLACAIALARSGCRVTVLEKKSDAGEKLHTTGIIVKDAIDQIPLLDHLPETIVRRVPGVRLYAPNLQHVDLQAPGYYFLTTDTPELMRWFAAQAEAAGARIRYRAVFTQAERIHSGFDLGAFGTTRFLVGADGPSSTVAKVLGLGRSGQFLFGVEREYRGVELAAPDRLHCFVDRKLAPGYIGWLATNPVGVQVGLARRVRSVDRPAVDAFDEFLLKIAPVFDVRDRVPDAVRAGMIPCGGSVTPVAARRVLLAGDAAGIVSPVTAGGIHNALKHGMSAGFAVADFLGGRQDDPSTWFVRSYPRYRTKRALRFLFDRFQSDLLFNAMLRTPVLRAVARRVYFHHKGTFDPPPRVLAREIR